jgi:hypothetical protein
VLVVRDSLVGLMLDDGFAALPTDEHIVFDSTLYVPPLGTQNRRIDGELGRYQLDLGDGYLLHGTPRPETIGTAATHGCVRLYDEDLEWLFENVPVGARVYIYRPVRPVVILRERSDRGRETIPGWAASIAVRAPLPRSLRSLG